MSIEQEEWCYLCKYNKQKEEKMEDSDCSTSLSSLLCREDETCLEGEGGEEGEEVIFVNDSALSETEDEYIEILVSREGSFESRSNGFSGDASTAVAEDWLERARSDAVRWILKTRAYFGFSLQTAYLSVTYLDRFFVRRSIDRKQSWAIQLLSMACLSLAAKMEECKVPALSEFQVEEHQFDNKAVQRMELLVLNTLEWRMSSVTPFLYLNYFASKFRSELRPKDLFSRAIGFIFATIEAINLVDYRPSAIAVAAIFAASDQALTKRLLEAKMGISSMRGSLEIDHVLHCYNMMIQESKKSQNKLKLHKILITSDISSLTCPSINSPVDAIDDISFSNISSKRRRLSLDGNSCNCPISNRDHSD